MRSFFANGAEKMHVPWAVEGLPALIHLSMFLFFVGLLILLFNINHRVFISVALWICLLSMVYGLITLLPIIRHDSPYNSPFSAPVWFLYTGIQYLTFKIFAFISGKTTTLGGWSFRTWRRCEDLRYRYQGWMLGGVEKAAEGTALERSSEINVQIFDWTISALGDDDSLTNLFEATPSFFHSKLVKRLEIPFPQELLQKFRDALDGFLGRTLSSNSVDDLEKVRRVDIAMNAMNLIHRSGASFILWKNLFKHWDEMPQTLENGHTLARWCTSGNQTVAQYAQATITRILVSVRERNDSWVTLAARILDLPEQDFRGHIALGDDSVLLAVLIHITRRYLCSGYFNHLALEALSKLDIHNTHPRLQHDFCTLWNEIVREARKQGPSTTRPVDILRSILHPYFTLHQGTNAAPAAFSASTDKDDDILFKPLSYPFCDLASHHPDSIAHISVPDSREVPLLTPANSPDALSPSPTDGSSTFPQVKQTNVISGLPASYNLTITSKTSQAPDTTLLTHSDPRPTDDSPSGAVAAMTQAITPNVTGTSQILSTVSTHYNAGVASFSNSSRFAPTFIHSFIPASRPTGSATFPRLRTRGLVNTGDRCIANAVVLLLVNSSPFRNLFENLVDLQRGARFPETGGVVIPLVDATVKFLKEFVVEKESPSTQQQSQLATGGTSRADEEKGDNVVASLKPTYLYDAMKEKRQLKPLLVRSFGHVWASCY